MTFDTSGLIHKTNRGGTVYYENASEDIVAKACTKCDVVKELGGFYTGKKAFAGRQAKCKECESEYRRNNRDKMTEYGAEYYRNNRDKLLKYWAGYRLNNRNKIADRSAEYYRNNRNKIAEQSAEYRKNNRDKIAEQSAEYRRINSDKIAEYRRNNLHIFRLKESRRRARSRNLPDDLTHEQKAEILAHFDGACALSGVTGDGHLDHVIPVSIGHGGTIRENMIPLRADLNRSKHARNLFDWFADNRERFGLEQRRFDELITYLADINGMSTQEYEEYVRWCHDNPRDLTKEDDDATA